jgi:hypothetical protein
MGTSKPSKAQETLMCPDKFHFLAFNIKGWILRNLKSEMVVTDSLHDDHLFLMIFCGRKRVCRDPLRSKANTFLVKLPLIIAYKHHDSVQIHLGKTTTHFRMDKTQRRIFTKTYCQIFKLRSHLPSENLANK